MSASRSALALGRRLPYSGRAAVREVSRCKVTFAQEVMERPILERRSLFLSPERRLRIRRKTYDACPRLKAKGLWVTGSVTLRRPATLIWNQPCALVLYSRNRAACSGQTLRTSSTVSGRGSTEATARGIPLERLLLL